MTITHAWWPALLRTSLSPFLTGEEKRVRLESASDAINWGAVASALEGQHLLPVVSRELDRLDIVGLPEPLRAKARREYDANWVFWQFERDTLRTILEAVAAAEIPGMILRGPHLVELAYEGDYGLRPFRDIDVAVLPSHVRLFVEAVRRRACPLTLRARDRSRAELKARLGSRMELAIRGIPVDLHWDLTLLYNFHRPRRIASLQYGVWERAEKWEFERCPCRVMGKEDLLVHLAEHTVIQHDLGGLALRNLVDFARCFARLSDAIDLDLVTRLAAERNSASALSAVCLAVREVVEVPERFSALRTLAERAPQTVRRAVGRQLRGHAISRLGGGKGPAEKPSLLRKIYGQLQTVQTMAALMDGVGTRLAFLREYALPRRRLLSYAFDASIRWPGYLAYLAVHPLVQILLAPAVGALILRQIEDLLHPSRRQRKPVGSQSCAHAEPLARADLGAALDLLAERGRSPVSEDQALCP